MTAFQTLSNQQADHLQPLAYYIWYPIKEANRIPTEETGSLERPMRTVLESHSSILLFTAVFGGAEAGFFFPPEQQFYRHWQEYDEEDDCYD